MADKLDWMNKHLTLIRYLTLDDAVDKEGYKIRPDLTEHFVGVHGAEEMVFKFARLGDYKNACELLAYIAHRRAGIWWGYRCVLSLLDELDQNPAADRDIAEIGASFDVEVPDFAKVEIPAPDPAQIEQVKAALAKSKAELAEARAKLDPEMLQFVEDAVEVAFQEFKRVHGIHPIDLLKKIAGRVGEDPYRIDPNSPLFVEAEKVKAQIQAARKDAVETIKAVITPKVPAHEKKLRDNTLDAVYRWVAVPDGENSQKCLDLGNECPDTPGGLLSLSSFWAFGNLLPLGEQVVATPPGLAANGLAQTLLMCALHKGGVRKVKERYEEYFNLGVGVLTGADNWEESLAAGIPPHRARGTEPGQASGNRPEAAPPASPGEGGYRRWTPPPRNHPAGEGNGG
ncbi:MAG: hypothetical protein LBP42_01955 [Treponema sp.]|jgi:hypothetical protein|nr:hypothetical protein [Treponema sp.]